MTVKWEADWYELDQCIVVGDIDLFYLTKDNLYFENGLSSSGKYEYEPSRIFHMLSELDLCLPHTQL